jgi:putative glycerol-1-phosphate prenyltransferase
MKGSDFPGKKSIGLLLDPDKAEGDLLDRLISIAAQSMADFILVGGSLTFKSAGDLIDQVKSKCTIPVVLFPGNLMQLSLNADIIMLLSLISGRNPELLIGNHVIAAPFLKVVKEKVVPVGYMLVGNGDRTSVEYISQTEAIPSGKIDIAIATALAGELLGLRMIYLEAGSGAENHVSSEMIKAVKETITIPLAVGGGIKDVQSVSLAFKAGADLVILGNACEKDPGLLAGACSIRDSLRKLP